jgi:hypothetical protein
VPEWRTAVRQRLATLGLRPEREAEIVEELSQHLEDRYAELQGALGDEAAERVALAELDGLAAASGEDLAVTPGAEARVASAGKQAGPRRRRSPPSPRRYGRSRARGGSTRHSARRGRRAGVGSISTSAMRCAPWRASAASRRS